VKFGVALPSFGYVVERDAVIRVAQAAERLGYDSVWAADHVAFPIESNSRYPYSDTAMVASGRPAAADPLVSLALVAGCTETIGLGTSVLVLPYRNPLVTAKMIATLDVLSGGRTVVGAGAGWLEEEFEALSAPDFASRGAVTDEWIEILRACWSQPTPSFQGVHYSFAAVDFQPQPLGPIPIYVGGNSPAALRRAGRTADGWLGTAMPVEDAPAAVATIRSHAESAGRDPAALTLACGYTLHITEAPQDPSRHLVGTIDQIADHVAALDEAGLDHLELRLAALRDPARASLDDALRTLETFAAALVS
jgi:probable F420-dependent oxidoreductase